MFLVSTFDLEAQVCQVPHLRQKLVISLGRHEVLIQICEMSE